MNFFVRFLHNPYNPLKLMKVFKYFLTVDILISYECNSSSPLTFVEIRLHAIVRYFAIFTDVCCVFYFFLNDGFTKSEHQRLTKRIRMEIRT